MKPSATGKKGVKQANSLSLLRQVGWWNWVLVPQRAPSVTTGREEFQGPANEIMSASRSS